MSRSNAKAAQAAQAAKKDKYLLAAFAAFAFQGGVSQSDTFLESSGGQRPQY